MGRGRVNGDLSRLIKGSPEVLSTSIGVVAVENPLVGSSGFALRR